MLIGLDAIPLTEPKTGVGHYTFELARALALVAPENDFELAYPSTYLPIDLAGAEVAPSPQVSDEKAPTPHVNRNEVTPPPRSRRNDIEPTPRDHRHEVARTPNLKLARVQVGSLGRHWWSIGLPRYVRRRGIELFHGTNYDVPLRKRCATVLTLHDLSLFTHPETHQPGSVRRARRRLPMMLRTATVTVTPSESVRRDVCQRFGMNSEQVFAVPEAARVTFCPQTLEVTEPIRRRLGINRPFILAVATLQPRKNLPALIRAFELVNAALPNTDLQLVIAGGQGWLADPIFIEVERSPVKDRILFTGYLNDEELRALYSSCLLFVYPSLDEGFGLPLLEAMQCGAPVIASRIPALFEVAGEAALFVDPKSVQDIAAGISKLMNDEEERAHLSRAGLRRAAKFSWERAAQMTLEVYQIALERFARDR